jgi:hypothetical protein
MRMTRSYEANAVQRSQRDDVHGMDDRKLVQDLQRLAEIETHIEKIVIVAIAIKGLTNL